MKKRTIYVSLLVLLFIILPEFLIKIEDRPVPKKINVTCDIYPSYTIKEAYYVGKNKLYMFKDSSGKDEVISILKKEDPLIMYEQNNDYVYCTDKNNNTGWISNNSDNLNILTNIKSDYKIDVGIKENIISIKEKENILKVIACNYKISKDKKNEIVLGKFKLLKKFIKDNNYYFKFFANYYIVSTNESKKHNIIVEGTNIIISTEDGKWIYENIPEESVIDIHY